MTLRKALLVAAGVALIIATFAYVLPSIADYGEVWSAVKQLSWPWAAALAAVTLLNLATFAPPWQAVLQKLGFIRALELTQASTALSIVFPAGLAAGMAGSFGLLRSWGFTAREAARAIALVGLWNQLMNLSFPIVALFLLAASGAETTLLAPMAFVGVVVLGVVATAFALVLRSNRLAFEIGALAAALASWMLGKLRRRRVSWDGGSFERFRIDTGDLLRRRWHVLTLASLAGSLTVFAVLLVTLRALGIAAAEITVVEAFAAWSVARIIGSIPITPGGIGVVELGLTTALVAFGGDNAAVVATVLVYRFLTVVPTLALGLAAVWTARRHRQRRLPVP